MLTIRNRQLELLSDQRQAELVDRLVSHLAVEYPSWYRELQSTEVRAFVLGAIDLGDRHGIRTAWAVSTLVELTVEFGEGFERSDDSAWALELLRHPSLPDRLKIALLSEKLRERTGGRRIVVLEAGQTGRSDSR